MRQLCGAIAILLTFLPFLPLPFLPDVSSAEVEQAKRIPVKSTTPRETPKEPPMPFRAGETLEYRVAWATFSNAATVQLTFPERRDLYGWATWHFRAAIHTLQPVRTLFPMDDQFDSYSDSSTFESRQYEMYLDEMGKKQDVVVHLQAQGAPSRAPAPVVVVLPGTRDPLGAIYDLRAVDWQHSAEIRAPVFDGRNLYEMRAQLEVASEKLTVAAGVFTAARIGIRLYEHSREVRQTRFELWLTQGASHTPVLLSADLPFGTLHIELTRAAAP